MKKIYYAIGASFFWILMKIVRAIKWCIFPPEYTKPIKFKVKKRSSKGKKRKK